MTDLAFIGILFAACSFCVGVGAALGYESQPVMADVVSAYLNAKTTEPLL